VRAPRVTGLVIALLVAAPGAAAGAPNDPLYDASPAPGATNEQWDLTTDRGISADRAWELTTGAGITIGDLDVGVQLDHPDLASQWAINPADPPNGADDDGNGYVDDHRGWDFYAHDGEPTSETRNEHGTNVAGVLAAATDNGEGIAGIAPDARILPLRTSDNILHQGSRLAQAIVYATDRGASVISASLGADSFTRALRQAVRYAHARGTVIAVASGNEFHFHHHQPQVLPEVLAVGGINPDTANIASKDQRLAVAANDFTVKAAYADFGPHLDVVAPTQVPTTTWGGGYRLTWEGTSAATPHVAGVVALVQARAKQLNRELSANQVIQIVRGTADDLQKPGWDRLTGYGRANARRAVERVSDPPPEAKIEAPFIYAPKTRPFRVWGRTTASWRLELGRGEEPTTWRTIARGRANEPRLARIDPRDLEPGGWTLRLTAGEAQDRSFFYAERHEQVRELGTSGESSPQLADVNGDGRADIVLATSDGTVRVLSGRTLKPLKGWPRRADRAPHSAPTERRLRTPVRSGFLATPAVGDVAGDARPEVVAADLDGRIYAWTSRGRRVFVRHINLQEPGDEEKTSKLDAAIYASPALADLDANGKLDIVVGAADQHVYAVDGAGRDLPGWPVLARDGDDHAKILSSPAIGDLDGDSRPDVVEGTAEVYGSTPDTSGRVYAFDHSGRPKPGWPIRPKALAADAIPLAGEGTPMSPVLADVDEDGTDEVAIAGFTGTHELFDGAGTQRHAFAAGTTLAFGANAAFGRQGGRLRLFGGVVDDRLVLAQLNPASQIPFDHLRAGWDAATGDALPGYPKPVEGWQIAAGPAIADVTGDGEPEVLAGSSGNVLHATQADGTEPPGWPKQTGGWLLAAPAAGDVDGDGRTEVVAVTRDGFLLVFQTPGDARAAEWPTFRHDPHNTGRHR
jgi:hypothetical protein